MAKRTAVFFKKGRRQDYSTYFDVWIPIVFNSVNIYEVVHINTSAKK
jgi:hypothetical protein